MSYESIPCHPGLESAHRIGFARTMRRVVLANETDWEGWRKATRSLVLAGAPPEEVRWSVRSHDEEGDPLREETGSFGVSRTLITLASLAIQARDPERFDLLYRLVWRANAGEQADAEETRRAQGLAVAVRAETHRMRTLLRYLPVAGRQTHPLPRLVRTGAFCAGGECATDRPAVFRSDVFHSSRPMPPRIGTEPSCGFRTGSSAKPCRTMTRCCHGGRAHHARLAAPRACRHRDPRGGTARRSAATAGSAAAWSGRAAAASRPPLQEAMHEACRLPPLPSP